MSITLAKLDVGINTEDSTCPTGRAGLSADALPGQNLSLILDDALDVGLYCHDRCLHLVVVFVLPVFSVLPSGCSSLFSWLPHLEICCEDIV